MFQGKDVLKICSKFTGEHPCRSAISINLLHISKTLFLKNTSGWLLLPMLTSRRMENCVRKYFLSRWDLSWIKKTPLHKSNKTKLNLAIAHELLKYFKNARRLESCVREIFVCSVFWNWLVVWKIKRFWKSI